MAKKKISRNTEEIITLVVIVVSVLVCTLCVFSEIKEKADNGVFKDAFNEVLNNSPLGDTKEMADDLVDDLKSIGDISEDDEELNEFKKEIESEMQEEQEEQKETAETVSTTAD